MFADPVFSNDDPRVSTARLAHSNPAEKDSGGRRFEIDDGIGTQESAAVAF